MALKDWKKIINKNESTIKWRNIKTSEVLIFQQNFSAQWIVYSAKFPLITPKVDKSFSSKTNALKFAKQYMRTH
jgi:hypothetical protein